MTSDRWNHVSPHRDLRHGVFELSVDDQVKVGAASMLIELLSERYQVPDVVPGKLSLPLSTNRMVPNKPAASFPRSTYGRLLRVCVWLSPRVWRNTENAETLTGTVSTVSEKRGIEPD